MYREQGKFSLAVGLAGNAGMQCAQARQGEKRVLDGFNPTSGQSTGNFSLTSLDGKEREKGVPPERKTGLCSRKFTSHFNSSVYTSTGLVPCLDWETTDGNTYVIRPQAFWVPCHLIFKISLG